MRVLALPVVICGRLKCRAHFVPVALGQLVCEPCSKLHKNRLADRFRLTKEQRAAMYQARRL